MAADQAEGLSGHAWGKERLIARRGQICARKRISGAIRVCGPARLARPPGASFFGQKKSAGGSLRRESKEEGAGGKPPRPSAKLFLFRRLLARRLPASRAGLSGGGLLRGRSLTSRFPAGRGLASRSLTGRSLTGRGLTSRSLTSCSLTSRLPASRGLTSRALTSRGLTSRLPRCGLPSRRLLPRRRLLCSPFRYCHNASLLRAGWLSITLTTSARRTARIAFETRAVADEREVPAFSTCFPFITLNARFGDKIGRAAFSERLDGASHMLCRGR